MNLFKTAVIQRRRVETGTLLRSNEGKDITFIEPRIHALVYEPTTGECKKLNVDFSKYLKVKM